MCPFSRPHARSTLSFPPSTRHNPAVGQRRSCVAKRPRSPAPRDKARQPVDSRMGPFSPFPTSSPRSPPSSPSTKVTGASRRALASRLLSPWRQRGSWPILVCTRILRRLGSLQARSRTRYFPHGQVFRESWKTSGLLGFWKNCGRIVEEWGGRLSLPNIPRRESKIPVFFFRVVFRDGRCAAQPRILLQGGVSALVSGGTRAHKPSQERLERKTVPLKRKHHGVRSEPAEDNLGAFSGKHTVVWFLHTTPHANAVEGENV